MRHSSARPDGRRHLNPSAAGPGRPAQSAWLLLGNSRWHWAEATDHKSLSVRHQEAAAARLAPPPWAPIAWAAVGALPPQGWLDEERRLSTGDVPLQDLPTWLGVDRALAGWLAWRQCGGDVLVADAGTVLSLTRIDRSGRFRGGRLLAGLGLQLRAMAEATAALPQPPAPGALAQHLAQQPWPAPTAAAMVAGVGHGLAAALVMALRELRVESPQLQLVLTGGDGASLYPLVEKLLGQEARPRLEPDLALRALVELRPPPAQLDQARPRSAST